MTARKFAIKAMRLVVIAGKFNILYSLPSTTFSLDSPSSMQFAKYFQG